MHEITVTKMDTDTSFHLKFVPLDTKGKPTDPTGTIVFSNSDDTIGTLIVPDVGVPAVRLVQLTGKIGTSDIVAHDDIGSVTCHVVVKSGAETDATLEVSA